MDLKKAEMFEQQRRSKAAGNVEEKPEVPLNLHLSQSFKEYIKEKYCSKDEKMMENPEIL